MRTALIVGFAAALGMFVGACSKEESADTTYKPREAPTFSMTPTTQPTAATTPSDVPAGLPAGHPPIPSRNMANNPHGTASPHGMEGMTNPHGMGSPHGATAPSTEPGEEETLVFQAPKGWTSKPARPMTEQVFAAPKVEGDAADADVAVSTLGTASIPLQMNVERWCTQFELPEGKTCEQASKTEPLKDAKLPTSLVEIAGAYRGGGMMGPSGPAKPGYKMLAAEIRTPGQLWFVKMVGPEKTVEHWRAALVDMARSAQIQH
jgi:hypothetical protein